MRINCAAKAKKMAPVLERRAPHLRQLQIQFVHQPGRLQRVAAPAPLQISQRDASDTTCWNVPCRLPSTGAATG
jgi:hypothetical protein